ncbi:hypothetical protein bas43_0212 [Escherichia phage TadeuszReichstein]|nr:hypothetical protein bas43_0212 [Escherichia phage TadeuszReichstein]
MKIEALNQEGNIYVIINGDFFVDMDEVTSEELVELLKKRYNMCDEVDTYMCVLKAGGDRHPDFISIRQNNGEISLSKSEAEAMIKYLTTVTPSMKG